MQLIQTPAGLSEEELERYNFLEEFGSRTCEVFDTAGRFLGVVELPPPFQPRLFRKDEIYGVWWDGLDVQYVMRLRVVEPCGFLHQTCCARACDSLAGRVLAHEPEARAGTVGAGSYSSGPGGVCSARGRVS